MRLLKQSTARDISVFMTDSADHITGKTGLTLTIKVGKNGGALTTITPTVTEDVSGWYTLSLTTTHTNTLGDLNFHITSAGADPSDFLCMVVAVDLADAVRGGLTALPNANAEAAGGLYTRGTGAGQINQVANGQVDANLVTGVGIVRRNTAAAGGGSTITLDAGAVATDSFYKNTFVVILSGTGVGQVRGYSSYVGSTKVYTVDAAWTTNPDNTSVFAIVANPGTSVSGLAAGSITLATFAADAKANLFGYVSIIAKSGGTFSRTSIQLDTGASSSNSYYNGALVYVVSGTGVGGWALIDGYIGSSRTCALAGSGLQVAPDDTAVFAIIRGSNDTTSSSVQEIIDGPASIIEGSNTLGDSIRLLTAVCAGLASGFDTGVIEFKSLDGTKVRITISTDGTGRIANPIGDLT